MRPAILPLGDKWLASIKADYEEVLKDANGQNVVFDTSTRAMAAAIAACRDKAVQASLDAGAGGKISEKMEYDDSDFCHVLKYTASWREEKAIEAQKSRDLFTLRNVKVVRRKRRA